MLSVNHINISNFRNYEAARVTLKSNTKFVVISGKNGAGKTNLLEAVSLLVSGKGLRNANLVDMRNRTLPESYLWTLSGEVTAIDGETSKIGTALDKSLSKRIVRLNNDDAKSQSELDEFVSMIWLTPQMDRLFLESSTERRRFLDRLVMSYDASHSIYVSRYEKAMRERLKLLQMENFLDDVWLSTLEKQMAENAVIIASSRINLVNHLKGHIAELNGISPMFPEPAIRLENWIEQELLTSPAVEIEEKFKAKLRQNRFIDKETKRTTDGSHRVNLQVFYKAKNIPADQCSTGEQKALLISIVLGHALMMQAEKGYVPIILLDEIAAHLDDERREQLFNVLRSLNGQIWLTGTDKNIFNSLKDEAKMFYTEEGIITEL